MNLTRASVEVEEVIRPLSTTMAKQGEDADCAIDRFVYAHTVEVVVLLSALAALRILIFCAAFPLTNAIDERFHRDTIQMYAHGHLPGRDLPSVDPQATKNLLLYWSPEYGLTREETARDGITGPLWGLSSEQRESALAGPYYRAKLQQWLRRPNFEAQSTPLYYLLAAGWYRMGAAFGLKDWALDYWLRVLNPIAYALLVWLSYQCVRIAYPDRPFLQIAVPALIAVFPQDVFYGMNRDVLSAPVSAATLLLLVRAMKSKTNWARLLLAASLLTSLAFLVNVSNVVLYGALAATAWICLRRSGDSIVRKLWIGIAGVIAAIGLPLIWMLRNYMLMADFTGGKAKTEELGWTVKPLSELLHHPLFSWHGATYFLTQLGRSFWRGEYSWHALPMRSVWADWFYLVSSAILVLLFAIDLMQRRKTISSLQGTIGFQSLFLVGSSILFLAVISLPYDFHDCAYPSRLYPYFVSGRIISGAMLPFILMYAAGLDLFARFFRRWIPATALIGCLLLLITVSEIRVRRAAFSSPYNFFALSHMQRPPEK